MIENIYTRNPKLFDRLFEILPGFLTWSVLLSPLWLGPIFPLGAAFILTFLVIFWVYRAVLHLAGVYIGYRRYKAELSSNWLKKASALFGFEKIKHLVLVPVVSESREILEGTFQSIAKSLYPKDKIYLVFSVEEREGERVYADLIQLLKKYHKELGRVWIFVHPANLAGEIPGAAANRTWGVKKSIERLRKEKRNLSDFLVTTWDADMQVHPQFLARVTCAFLTSPNPEKKFFQTAVYLFENNIWEVPPLMRIQAHSITLAVLSSWVFEPERKDTWSCYSVYLPTLQKVGFWDVRLGIDDTPFYWKTYFALNGDFSGAHFYIPVYADAVSGKNFFDAHAAQYKQLLRWGWGVISFPIALKGLLTSKTSFAKKVSQFARLFEQYTIWRTVTVLVTFGFLGLSIINPAFQKTTLGVLLPTITGWILTSAFIFLLPLAILKAKISSPPPSSWPIWKKFWVLLEGPLVIINLLTYAFFPYVDAETRFMLGRGFKFQTTPKIRKEGIAT